MTGSIIPVSQRNTQKISGFSRFLWWLSTAEEELLIDCIVDRNRYRIIGMSVLGTWLFATFSWMYFFSTITSSWWAWLLAGIFMGFIILCIDRALIKGIHQSNKKKIIPLLFRGLLALTIGTFMAQPAILYMFDKEIRLQVSLDNEKKKQLKLTEIETLFKKRKTELINTKEQLINELAAQNKAVEKARTDFLTEADGSGGTGKIGIKDIAIAKRNEYQKLDEAYQQAKKNIDPKIEQAEKELSMMEDNIQKQQLQFETYFNDGFLTRIEALNHLLANNMALAWRYYLVVFILMLIELMPVIAKTLLPVGSYDEKVHLREQMEIFIARNNAQKEQEIKEWYNQQAFENDKEIITQFFSLSRNDRQEKIKSLSKKWKENEDERFDDFWARMKKEVLTKQEN